MIIIEDLPDKSREACWYFGFERWQEDSKRTKEAWIVVLKVTNPDYVEAFGKYVVYSWFIGGNEIYETKRKAINAAKRHLENLKEEYRSGKRNWWTSKLKKEVKTMVYLKCPRCNEQTEHELLAVSDTKLFARCTECLVYWRAPYEEKEIYYDGREEKKKEY